MTGEVIIPSIIPSCVESEGRRGTKGPFPPVALRTRRASFPAPGSPPNPNVVGGVSTLCQGYKCPRHSNDENFRCRSSTYASDSSFGFSSMRLPLSNSSFAAVSSDWLTLFAMYAAFLRSDYYCVSDSFPTPAGATQFQLPGGREVLPRFPAVPHSDLGCVYSPDDDHH